MRLTGLLIVALVATALGGCAADEPTDAPPSDANVTSTMPAAGSGDTLFNPDGSADLPTWQVGDWWQYAIAYQSGESYDAKIIVYAEDGANYYVTSDNNELLFRAAFTHYPTFGAVKKSSLNHLIHGIEVPFLKFPMQNQSWEAPFRDFTGAFSTTSMKLTTPKGDIQGFQTTMANADDGNVRMVNGWSPATKYFTTFVWDFDGVAPTDVEFTIKDWGTNFTGSVPVLDITEGVHRTFPTVVVAAPPNGPPAAGPDNRAAFTVPAEADLLVGMFAGAGGPGDFEMQVNGANGRTANFPWRATGAGSYFDWELMADFPAGECTIIGTGAAQTSAFLFLEAYAVKQLTVEL